MMARLRISLLTLPVLLLGALLLAAPALAQDDGDSSSQKEKAGEKEAGEAAEEEVPLATAGEVAESLRQSGQVVSQTGDLKIAVDPQYYAEFPGYDLDHLTSGQHAWLLKQANSIYCTCGCRGDTVARCVVLDPTCQTARQMLDKMAGKAGELTEEELKAAAADPGETPQPPSN
jgi:hypothetical protein